jgi:hypothetical protein
LAIFPYPQTLAKHNIYIDQMIYSIISDHKIRYLCFQRCIYVANAKFSSLKLLIYEPIIYMPY